MFLDTANPVVRSAVQVPQSPFNSLDTTRPPPWVHHWLHLPNLVT